VDKAEKGVGLRTVGLLCAAYLLVLSLASGLAGHLPQNAGMTAGLSSIGR
jgi:hypothetical protein